MLVPLVRTLKSQLPKLSITWIIARPAYDLVEGLEGVDFVVINKPDSLADYWTFRKKFKDRRFDVLLAAQACLRTNLLIPLIKASRKIGYDAKRAKDGHGLFVQDRIQPGNDHTLEGFLKFATVLGLSLETPVWNLPIKAEDYAFANHHLPADGFIMVVNPAASKPERSWLLESYIAVIKHVQKKWKAVVVLTGGPSSYDKELATAILKEVAAINLVGKTKPRQLLAVISRANLVLCPDTGPSHMAAAVSTPVVALHAVTNPFVSGPYPYRDLVVNYYPEALKKMLNKEVNTKTWGRHVHGAETMQLIPVEAVIKRLDETIEKLALGFN